MKRPTKEKGKKLVDLTTDQLVDIVNVTMRHYDSHNHGTIHAMLANLNARLLTLEARNDPGTDVV